MKNVIYARQLVEVTRRLVEQGVRDTDPQLRSKFQNAFQIVLGGSVAQRASQINIDLPDLEQDVQTDIVKDNVLALSAIYFCAQLEDLKLFSVADKVADQFLVGAIPTTRTVGGEAIYRYIKDAPERFTETERRSLYARCFGFAQGAVEEQLPNREFGDLWIRFLSAVSVLSREQDATVRKAVTDQQVFKNARDLAVNLSLHGYGVAHFAAVELQDLVKNTLKMLSFPDVLSAFGVQDVWQLVERVSALYLGGAVNGVRQRTLAQAGSKIIQWLAKNQPVLASSYAGTLQISKDLDLIQNVERWLAVTGTDDAAVDRYSAPVSVPSQPTIPGLSLQGLTDGMNLMRKPDLQAAMQNMANLTPMKA